MSGTVLNPIPIAHVVMFSGGVGSWAAAKRVAEQYGTKRLHLLFCDTLTEDADTYAWLLAAAANVGGTLHRVADGRNIWEVFRDEKYLGNTRADPCSRILKRQAADRWLSEHYTPETCIVYVGIDWTERHRYDRLAKLREPWVYSAPLCDAPYLLKPDLHAWAKREGLWTQRLYRMGMPHANCGGGCVKAGMGHFARLLAADPTRFAEWEQNEGALRQQLGDVSILRDRRGGETRTLTLRTLRERVEAREQIDLFDIGGCGCMVEETGGDA